MWGKFTVEEVLGKELVAAVTDEDPVNSFVRRNTRDGERPLEAKDPDGWLIELRPPVGWRVYEMPCAIEPYPGNAERVRDRLLDPLLESELIVGK
jgi:catechol 2,3-dioxygenase-like lactoylglutathione lyase family enzyme